MALRNTIYHWQNLKWQHIHLSIHILAFTLCLFHLASCDTETTICLPASNSSTQRSAYTCVCNLGFYLPNQTYQGFEGHIVEAGNGNYSCIRCPNGCACDGNGQCSLGELQELVLMEETLLHFSIGVVLGACMLCILVLFAIVFRQRKSKVRSICFEYVWIDRNVIHPLSHRLFRLACGPFWKPFYSGYCYCTQR